MLVLISLTIFLLLFISGVSKAIMDTLQFHFYKSIFKDKGSWWDASISWKNKYEWFPNSKILTWLISNPFVLITDAWHFFQFIYSIGFALSFLLIGMYLPVWVFLIGYILNRMVFHLFYTYIFKR